MGWEEPIGTDRTPVLVGVGEASRATLDSEWPAPLDLAAAAARIAAADAGLATLDAVDTLVVIRSFHDSGVPGPFGGSANPPFGLARRLGISPRRAVHGDVGGHSPQLYLSEFAQQVKNGEAACVLIAGGEATATMRRAIRQGIALDWHEDAPGSAEDRLTPDPVLSREEIRHGIVSMPIAYSLVENARRSQAGCTREQHLAAMAQSWAAMAPVAATRRHAHFALPHVDPMTFMTFDDGNYRLTDPYPRWLVAQDAVDLGAALLLTSVGHARELGIAEDRWVYPLGGGDADDGVLSARPDPARSAAMAAAFDAAFDASGIDRAAIGPVDLYSCFPCAVAAAADCLGRGADDRRPLSLTGGLTFFGGPGNSYALHSIAALVDLLRRDRSATGLISANGGVLAKHAVGLYSGRRPSTPFAVLKGRAVPPGRPPLTIDTASGPVESYAIAYDRDAPRHATLFLASLHGRVLVRVDAGDPMLGWLVDHDPLGVRFGVRADGKVHRIVDFAR